jgi:hypothetical protein
MKSLFECVRTISGAKIEEKTSCPTATKYIPMASFWLSTISRSKRSHDSCLCHCEPIQATSFIETESEEDWADKLISRRNITRRSTFEGFRIRSTFHRADHRTGVYPRIMHTDKPLVPVDQDQSLESYQSDLCQVAGTQESWTRKSFLLLDLIRIDKVKYRYLSQHSMQQACQSFHVLAIALIRPSRFSL